jgi:hypothetical protein
LPHRRRQSDTGRDHRERHGHCAPDAKAVDQRRGEGADQPVEQRLTPTAREIVERAQ